MAAMHSEASRPVLSIDTRSVASDDTDATSLILTPTSTAPDTTTDIVNHSGIVAYRNFAQNMAVSGPEHDESQDKLWEEEKAFLNALKLNIALNNANAAGLTVGEYDAAIWKDIEDKTAITDAYDTCLSVAGQEAALWKDIERKSAVADAFDSGLTVEDQEKALWKDIENKSDVTDLYNAFAWVWIEKMKGMEHSI
ncbi:uncharacterized protein PAC_11398 [Phialocephala subalpina]|uniref:Uncharacterized protein n=1 Tax=Phialocephala subalpina TaxID=576137 RepID=A0A1L7X903_9HELO|nr:uncharacterized protein PAC_11398 [Phialocephala subalpina]